MCGTLKAFDRYLCGFSSFDIADWLRFSSTELADAMRTWPTFSRICSVLKQSPQLASTLFSNFPLASSPPLTTTSGSSLQKDCAILSQLGILRTTNGVVFTRPCPLLRSFLYANSPAFLTYSDDNSFISSDSSSLSLQALDLFKLFRCCLGKFHVLNLQSHANGSFKQSLFPQTQPQVSALLVFVFASFLIVSLY